MTAAAVQAQPSPIIVLRSANRAGETYALDSDSLKRVRSTFGSRTHPRPRVFIAHEPDADYAYVHGDVAPQIIQILTGVSERRLRRLGAVIFCEAVTMQKLRVE